MNANVQTNVDEFIRVIRSADLVLKDAHGLEKIRWRELYDLRTQIADRLKTCVEYMRVAYSQRSRKKDGIVTSASEDLLEDWGLYERIFLILCRTNSAITNMLSCQRTEVINGFSAHAEFPEAFDAALNVRRALIANSLDPIDESDLPSGDEKAEDEGDRVYEISEDQSFTEAINSSIELFSEGTHGREIIKALAEISDVSASHAITLLDLAKRLNLRPFVVIESMEKLKHKVQKMGIVIKQLTVKIKGNTLVGYRLNRKKAVVLEVKKAPPIIARAAKKIAPAPSVSRARKFDPDAFAVERFFSGAGVSPLRLGGNKVSNGRAKDVDADAVEIPRKQRIPTVTLESSGKEISHRFFVGHDGASAEELSPQEFKDAGMSKYFPNKEDCLLLRIRHVGGDFYTAIPYSEAGGAAVH